MPHHPPPLNATNATGATNATHSTDVSNSTNSTNSTNAPRAINIRGVQRTLEAPIILGIINLTPDSFSDGGQLATLEAAVRHAEAMLRSGAHILDVGGESTRPGSKPVDAETEIGRVLPFLRTLRRTRPDVLLSIDTAKAAVAREALAAGAHVVNDVTALRDPEMADVVAAADAGLILMHMRGEPSTMQEGPIVYDDLMAEITTALGEARDRARSAGVRADALMVDPGIGFGKTLEHNLELTQRLAELHTLGCPIIYGPSRKRFLGEITGRPVEQRDEATAAACVAAVLAGADGVRVHNPAAVCDGLRVAAALRRRH